jgi:hypothetical protein
MRPVYYPISILQSLWWIVVDCGGYCGGFYLMNSDTTVDVVDFGTHIRMEIFASKKR